MDAGRGLLVVVGMVNPKSNTPFCCRAVVLAGGSGLAADDDDETTDEVTE